MNTTSSAIRVKSIHVKGLFGIYDHDVVLNNDTRMTVIHGPNGVGKTVIFKLAIDLLAGSGSDLLKYPFQLFQINFTNDTTLSAKSNSHHDNLRITSTSGSNTSHIDIKNDFLNKIAHRLARRLPINQAGPNLWLDPETGEILNSNKLVSQYKSRMDGEFDSTSDSPLNKYRNDHDYIPKVHLIEAQRLIKFHTSSSRIYRDKGTQSVQEAVVEYSQQIKIKINTTLAEYGRQAQKLDQTFPQRLLQPKIRPANIIKIKEELENIEQKQEKYKKLGLIEDGFHPIYGLDQLENNEVQLAAMTVYVTDMKAKLAVLEYLAERVSILLGQINEKLTNKTLFINSEHELAIKTSNGDELPVSCLSSGEQHQIVLSYDLLFRIEANSLVMIDEPELSFHVNWQERFLSDLESIIHVANFDALIATHSPYIVNGRNDLLVSLSAKDHSKDV